MQIVEQKLEDITAALTTLEAPWQDEHAAKVIALVQGIPAKEAYSAEDVGKLFDENFDAAFTAAYLFLGISKDKFQDRLAAALPGQNGVMRFKKDRSAYIAALDTLDLPAAMTAAVNFKPTWSDILIERLRSGRGKAIKGQTRGRGLEDFTEALVREVFGNQFVRGGQFTGIGGKVAKCDFAIPDRQKPVIVIEAKGYGATGSKMTDVYGDAEKIIQAKRPDVAFILITDGITWMRRINDLRSLIRMQNEGSILRIYTTKMAAQFQDDLRQLKTEYGL
ncbi:MAG: DpnII family type II restriction endonuclease [Bryobacteraceae bacterium]|nr:DpnII family type II restriction endonuclease [Bryobacteraceae bacterium]